MLNLIIYWELLSVFKNLRIKGVFTCVCSESLVKYSFMVEYRAFAFIFYKEYFRNSDLAENAG